jgi:hypothetical protein
MKKYIDFNINNDIKVEITEEGKKILQNFYWGGEEIPIWFNKNYIDEDGWYIFPLHEICLLFGSYLYNGNNNLPFKTNIKLIIED